MRHVERSTKPEDRYLTVEGVSLRYWEGGSGGDPVILVHGVGSYVERWLYTFRRLAEHHRVYAMDLPGRGLSDKPAHFDYHVTNLARIVKGFAEALGLPRVSLVGSSLGGAIVAHFARLYPDSVERLVLSSSAGWGRGVTPALRIVGLPGLGELIGTLQGKESARRLLEGAVHDPELVSEELVDLHYRMNSQPGAWGAFLRMLRANGTILGQGPSLFRPLRSELRSFDRSVLILWGDRDRVIPPSHALIAATVFPRVEIRILEGCGHFLMLERPEEYASLVGGFLEQSNAQPAAGTEPVRASARNRRPEA